MAALLEIAKVLLEKRVASLGYMSHSRGHNIILSRRNFIHVMRQLTFIRIEFSLLSSA